LYHEVRIAAEAHRQVVRCYVEHSAYAETNLMFDMTLVTEASRPVTHWPQAAEQ